MCRDQAFKTTVFGKIILGLCCAIILILGIIFLLTICIRNEKKQIREIKNLPEYDQYKDLKQQAKYLQDHN